MTASETNADRKGHPEQLHGRPAEPSSGWHQPLPLVLPRPTYWPATLALGVVFMFWGIVTTFIITGVGLAVVVISLAGWIKELRHAQRN